MAEEYWNVAGYSLNITDSLIVLFTALLVVSTVLLWCATNRAAAAAEKAASAADKTAASLLRSERAYVLAKVKFPPGLGIVSSHGGQAQTNISVQFPNRGRTVAFISRIRATYSLSAAPPAGLPEVNAPPLPDGLAIRSDGVFEDKVVAHITTVEEAKIEALELTLFVFGQISYSDIHGEQHETAFCWSYVPRGRGGQFVINPNANALNFRT